MKRLTASALALVGTATLGLVGSAVEQRLDEQAVGQGAQIVRVDYNAKGVDTSANAYQELVRVQNKNAATAVPQTTACDPAEGDVTMTGYTLQDTTGHTYVFPTYCLEPGDYVDVRTGRSPSTSATSWWNNAEFNLYWKRSTHQYGNASDSATLERADGTRVDRVAWSDFSIRP